MFFSSNFPIKNWALSDIPAAQSGLPGHLVVLIAPISLISIIVLISLTYNVPPTLQLRGGYSCVFHISVLSRGATPFPLGLFHWTEPSCAALVPAAALSPDQLHSVTSVLRNVISRHFTPCLDLRNTTLTQTGSGQQISGSGLAVLYGLAVDNRYLALYWTGKLVSPPLVVVARNTSVFPDRAKHQFV